MISENPTVMQGIIETVEGMEGMREIVEGG
jgi:hypothetical protein